MTIRKRDNLISGGIALGCLVFLWWIIPAYSPPYPGYGISAALIPNVTVGIILLLSLLSLGRNLWSLARTKPTNQQEEQSDEIAQESRVQLWHLARFLIPSVLLMPAMQLVGFIPAGVLFMLLIQYFCGQRKPLPAVLTAVASVGILYLAMRYGLGVPMP